MKVFVTSKRTFLSAQLMSESMTSFDGGDDDGGDDDDVDDDFGCFRRFDLVNAPLSWAPQA